MPGKKSPVPPAPKPGSSVPQPERGESRTFAERVPPKRKNPVPRERYGED